MGAGIILTGVLAIAAVVAGAAMAEVCYPDLVCQHCGEIMPGADHVCSDRSNV